MKKIPSAATVGAAFATLCPPALAASSEDTIALVTQAIALICIVFVVFVALAFYFLRSQDQRRDPLHRIYDESDEVHSVDPEALVSECVQQMAAKEIGALVVMEGTALRGIFTERDALKRVLAAGLDPARTRVGAVMTRDPVCIAPTTSVGEAMRVITQRRFRHLPVVENGRLLGIVSSGDLTRWLVKEKLEGVVKESVQFAVHPAPRAG